MDFDISIFKPYDIRGIVPDQINPDIAYRIGNALAVFLKPVTVAVGRGNNGHSRELCEAVIGGIIDAGSDIIDLGEISPDVLHFAVGKYDLDGGIMIAPGHVKKDEIEIKICRRRAMPLSGKQDLDQIRKALEDNTIEKSPNRGNMARKDILQEFIDHCFGLVDIYSIKPLKLIIEAHGGTANNFIPSILERLPVKTGPVLNSDMSANDIKVSGRADLGVEFDRAGGRITLYDSKGKSVAGDILTALVADYLLEKYPGETILYSLICSKAVPELIARKGGQALKTRVGPSLIRPMMKKHNALFGGEPSGYYYYRDNWFADSSIITFLIILEIISRSDRPLEQIVKDIDHYFRSGEITVRANSAREKMETIAEKYSSGIQDRLDGLSVEMDDFWFNIRLSNTEPAVRLNVEAISKELLDEKIEEILDLINS